MRHDQLARQQLIVGQIGTGMRQLVDDIRASGVPLDEAVESEHRELFLPLVLGGVGVAVLTDAWASLARQVGLLVLDIEPPAYLHVALAWRKGRLTPAAAAFLEVARASL